MDSVHREKFLKDMAALGDAVLKVTGAVRINYAMFGNAEPVLHAHVIPRYANEAAELRTAHPWSYDWDAATPFSLQNMVHCWRSLRRCSAITDAMFHELGLYVHTTCVFWSNQTTASCS